MEIFCVENLHSLLNCHAEIKIFVKRHNKEINVVVIAFFFTLYILS